MSSAFTCFTEFRGPLALRVWRSIRGKNLGPKSHILRLCIRPLYMDAGTGCTSPSSLHFRDVTRVIRTDFVCLTMTRSPPGDVIDGIYTQSETFSGVLRSFAALLS